jgi:hypothetical protein
VSHPPDRPMRGLSMVATTVSVAPAGSQCNEARGPFANPHPRSSASTITPLRSSASTSFNFQTQSGNVASPSNFSTVARHSRQPTHCLDALAPHVLRLRAKQPTLPSVSSGSSSLLPRISSRARTRTRLRKGTGWVARRCGRCTGAGSSLRRTT